MPKKSAAARNEAATKCAIAKKSPKKHTKFIMPPSPLTLVINLQRRGDRLRKLRKVLREGGLSTWERVDAVDGRGLTWDAVTPHLSHSALSNAQWAAAKDVPTICMKTGSFSPHLTLSAVGCALSHRKAWQALVTQKKHDWALVLEDDVSAVAHDLDGKLDRVVRSLPSSWQFCYVGFHEASGCLLGGAERLRFAELGPDESQTGLFGYMLRRSCAAELLACKETFPLRHQVDVQLGTRHWRVGSRFALSPEAVLVHSPKSEEGACDTDVQTLGHEAKRAHSGLLPNMLKL